MVWNDRWSHLQAEVFGNVKFRQLCIDIGIDDRQRIDTNHHKDAHITPTAVLVFTTLEYLLESFFVAGINLYTQVQKLVVAVSSRVGIHQVQVGLRIVLIHHVVP